MLKGARHASVGALAASCAMLAAPHASRVLEIESCVRSPLSLFRAPAAQLAQGDLRRRPGHLGRYRQGRPDLCGGERVPAHRHPARPGHRRGRCAHPLLLTTSHERGVGGAGWRGAAQRCWRHGLSRCSSSSECVGQRSALIQGGEEAAREGVERRDSRTSAARCGAAAGCLEAAATAKVATRDLEAMLEVADRVPH